MGNDNCVGIRSKDSFSIFRGLCCQKQKKIGKSLLGYNVYTVKTEDTIKH